jgi:pimeloyl-ACP methyl ester carboxylesterase
MEKCVPHSAVVRIPDARHGLFFDNPGGVNDALLNFLATAGRAPRK